MSTRTVKILAWAGVMEVFLANLLLDTFIKHPTRR
jgi:hypothetical protein